MTISFNELYLLEGRFPWSFHSNYLISVIPPIQEPGGMAIFLFLHLKQNSLVTESLTSYIKYHTLHGGAKIVWPKGNRIYNQALKDMLSASVFVESFCKVTKYSV